VLKTAGKQGSIKKRITVTSNDPNEKNLILEIQGEITVDVMLEPRNLSFKQLSKGEEATAIFSLKVSEPDKNKVTEVAADDPRFELKMTTGDLTSESKWEIKFKGAAEIGSVQAKLVVKYTSAGEPKTLDVPLRATVIGDLQYVRSIHFGKSPTNGFTEREVRFTSRSGKDVKITKVEDPDGLLKIDLVTPQGNPAVFKANVASPDGDYTKPTQHTLKVHTNDKDEPIVEISYMITIRKSGRAGLPKGMADRAPGMRPGNVLPKKGGAPNAPSAESDLEQPR
jgi:hypothetical protein